MVIKMSDNNDFLWQADPEAGTDQDESSKDPEVVETTPFDSNLPYVVLDVDKAQKGFVELKNTMAQLEKAARLIKVDDKTSNQQANEMVIQCGQLLKAVENAKKTMPEYKKAADFKNKIDKFTRETFAKLLQDIQKKILAPKISQFHKAEAELERRKAAKLAEEEAAKRKAEHEKAEKERIEREKKEREEALERQKKLDEEAKAAGVDTVEVDIPEVNEEIQEPDPTTFQAPVTDEPSKQIKTEGGSAKVEPVWVCKIINSDEVPREYCTPDQKKLDQAVKSGIRNIVGCEIKEEFEVRTRIKSRPAKKDDDEWKF